MPKIEGSLANVPAPVQPRSLLAHMTLQVDRQRLADAHQIVRSQLLAERNSAGHWVGELSSSPLSTATAISALVLAEQGGTNNGLPAFTPGEEPSHVDEIYRNDLSEMIVHSIQWLARQQNDDGGWGDTVDCKSNIATTMLVQAAFHLTGVPAKYSDLLEQAEAYVEAKGGIAGLKERYQGDKTFAVPILANCALADMVPWRKVSALPFELACVPQRWYNRLSLPVVSYAIPALVAIGQAKFFHCPPKNPLMRWIRNAAKKRSLDVLAEKQPTSGGFLEATPLTSFVVMSLASIGETEHPVVRQGVEFLLASVRPDGSWPIDTNLATWNTSQAVAALDWQCEAADDDNINDNINNDAGDNISNDVAADNSSAPSPAVEKTLDWLLSCQHQARHAFTAAEPGGWAWTDLSGGVPDADDTSAALLALADLLKRWPEHRVKEIRTAALAGVRWLLNVQNKDGGWPTFCRGWGKLPFDRSSTDITAHAIRALHAWSIRFRLSTTNAELARKLDAATRLGLQFIERQQQTNGSWLPLWFGNEHHPQEANPVYGTSKVLLMYQELDQADSEQARHGAQWLIGAQHTSGGWGAVNNLRSPETASQCSVEETSLALTALLPVHDDSQKADSVKTDSNRTDAQKANSDKIAATVNSGLSWLIEAVEQGQHLKPSPIGFYFAKLWYHERLYPQVFATQALAAATQQLPAEELMSAEVVHEVANH